MGGVVFLSCQLFDMGRPALELAGRWVELVLEISGRALAGPGGLWWSNVLVSALPPWRLRPDTRPEHQDPASHMAWKKRKKKKKKKKKTDRTPNQMVKAKLNRQKSHKETYTHTSPLLSLKDSRAESVGFISK